VVRNVKAGLLQIVRMYYRIQLFPRGGGRSLHHLVWPRFTHRNYSSPADSYIWCRHFPELLFFVRTTVFNTSGSEFCCQGHEWATGPTNGKAE
jgi:hypothetical protein